MASDSLGKYDKIKVHTKERVYYLEKYKLKAE